jgi:glycosyl transferase family 25
LHRISNGSVAYLLSAGGARKLLERATPGGRPFDVQFKHWWDFGLSIAGVVPGVAGHSGGHESTIGERKSLDRPTGAGLRRLRYKLAYSLARLWHERVLRGSPGRSA